MTNQELQFTPAAATGTGPFHAASTYRLFFDHDLTRPTPYHYENDYFKKARDRMDRTFDLISDHVMGGRLLDVGASPFYLLHRAMAHGAVEAQGIYFAYDRHPLKGIDTIYSTHGPLRLHHANIEKERLPFPDNSFDVLTACEILEHLDEFPAHFAGEIRRVLRPGGILCITVPNVASIGNILKLVFQSNIYMKYRSDVTGRHKHEYTASQLKALVNYLGFETLDAGFLPSPTSDKMRLRPAYRAIARTPGIRNYSPVLYIVARQPDVKRDEPLGCPPRELYSEDLSIEG